MAEIYPEGQRVEDDMVEPEAMFVGVQVPMPDPNKAEFASLRVPSPSALARETFGEIKKHMYDRVMRKFQETVAQTEKFPVPDVTAPQDVFGTYLTEEDLGEEVAPPTFESATSPVEKIMTSPTSRVVHEALREAYPIPVGDELNLADIPTFKETFGREKTWDEKLLKGTIQMAAELPLIVGAEFGAAAILPGMITKYAGKSLALHALNSATRLGVAGMGYETARSFGHQMMDPEPFDIKKLGKDAVIGLGTWGAFGALGGTLSGVMARRMTKQGIDFHALDKLKAEANNLGFTVEILDPTVRRGYHAIRMRGPKGTGRSLTFGTSDMARKYLRRADELGDLAMYLKRGDWEAFHAAKTQALELLQSRILNEVPTLARAQLSGGAWGRITKSVHHVAQMIEESVFGPKALRKLRLDLKGLGFTNKQIKAEMFRYLSQMGKKYRIFSKFVQPVTEANWMARKFNHRMGRWIHRNVNRKVNKMSKKWGYSPEQVAEDITDRLMKEQTFKAFDTLPETVQNHIRTWKNTLTKSENVGVAVKEIVEGNINRFVKQHLLPDEVVGTLAKWAVVSKKAPSLATIEKTIGKHLKGTKVPEWAKKIRKVILPKEQVGPSAKRGVTHRMADDLYVVDLDYMRALDEVAETARSGFNHMFRMAGLDPSIWRAWYVPHLRAVSHPSFATAMSTVPRHVKPRLKFFAALHKQGANFVPDKDIRSLLGRYAWGAGRHRYLKPALDRGQKMVEALPKGNPIREMMVKYGNDVAVGTSTQAKTQFYRAVDIASKGAAPFQAMEATVDALMATAYGGAMGFRPFLVLRNLTQTFQTTLVALARHPLQVMKAYAQAAHGAKFVGKKSGMGYSFRLTNKYWDDFYRQWIHMERGAGMPMGEEIFKSMTVDVMPKTVEAVKFKPLLKAAGALRTLAYLSTKPYQMADTLNRFVSYRSMMNAIEVGSKGRHFKRLVNSIFKATRGIETKPAKGKVTFKDLQRLRGALIGDILDERAFSGFLGSTGVRGALSWTLVDQGFSRPLMEAVFESSIKGGRIIYKNLGSKEAIAKALKSALFGARTGDSISRRMARWFVADTQWLYQRAVQPQWLQKKGFGMFMTWSANYHEFLKRTLTQGTAPEITAKVAMLGMTTATLGTGLYMADIDYKYMFSQAIPPTGGPFFQLALDTGRAVSPYTPSHERTAAAKRMIKMPLTFGFPGMAQARSMIQAATGKKPMVHGLLGAPYREKGVRRSHSQWQGRKDWDLNKLTPARRKAIERLMEQLQKHQDSGNEEAMAKAWYRLGYALQPIVKSVPQNVVAIARQVLEAKNK
jgi:hypothetical protein